MKKTAHLSAFNKFHEKYRLRGITSITFHSAGVATGFTSVNCKESTTLKISLKHKFMIRLEKVVDIN